MSLSEFQAIFLTCTEMTMDDVTELFNLFASHQGEMDQLESGSGLSGLDEEAYFYNDDYFFSTESLVSFIGPEEVRKMWDYFQTDLNPLSRTLTGSVRNINVVDLFLCVTTARKRSLGLGSIFTGVLQACVSCSLVTRFPLSGNIISQTTNHREHVN